MSGTSMLFANLFFLVRPVGSQQWSSRSIYWIHSGTKA